MAKVKLNSLLVKHTGIQDFESSAKTVGDLVDELKNTHGDSIERYLDGCIIMVNGKNVAQLKGKDTRLKSRSEVSIFPRVAGG